MTADKGEAAPAVPDKGGRGEVGAAGAGGDFHTFAGGEHCDKGGEERGLAQQGGGGEEGEEVENKLQLCDDVGQQTLAAAELEEEEP